MLAGSSDVLDRFESAITRDAEHFWRAGHIFHLSRGKGNLLGQRNIVRSVLFSAEA